VADEKEKKAASKPAASKKATTSKANTKSTTTAKAPAKSAPKAAPKAEAKKDTTAKAKAPKKEETKAAVKTANASKKEAKASKVEVDELVATATVKYERISSRKVAIVANLIRGKNVDEAMAILKFTRKAGSEVLIKLLKSAIANAENNKNMTHSKLYIAEIYSNQGPTLKRIRPAAKGSAVRIRKRTSHTTIVLKERD
jgi:large subunit ribosomal protein L22